MSTEYEDLKHDRDAWVNLAQEAGAAIGGLGHLWDEKDGIVARAKRLREERDTLKAEAEANPCINARETYDELHRLRRDVVGLEKEAGIHDPKWNSVSTHRIFMELRRLKSISKDFDRQGFPISPWLTRAISLSGAPEGSDWAGLLEHVGGQGQDREKLAAMGQSLEAESKSVDELKQQVDTLSSSNWCVMFHELGAAMGMRLGDDVDGAVEFARRLRERCEVAEQEAKDWKKSHDVAEQRRVAFESDSDSLHIERNKLRERAEAAETGETFAKDRLHVVRSLISGRDDRIEELEAKLAMTEATAAQLGISPLRPATPTQTDLSRIAAALEKRNELLFADKSEPAIHTQHGGKFDVIIT